MNIRPLKREEIDYVSALIGRNWGMDDAETSKKELTAMFTNTALPPRYLVAEELGNILGVTGYVQSWMDYHAYHIFWVNVDPEHQRRGIGTTLVERAIEEIKKEEGDNKAKVILLTAKDTIFYERKFGFRTLHIFKNTVEVMGLDVE